MCDLGTDEFLKKYAELEKFVHSAVGFNPKGKSDVGDLYPKGSAEKKGLNEGVSLRNQRQSLSL